VWHNSATKGAAAMVMSGDPATDFLGWGAERSRRPLHSSTSLSLPKQRGRRELLSGDPKATDCCSMRGATAAIGPYLSRKNQIVSFLILRWPRMPCPQWNSEMAALLLSARPRYIGGMLWRVRNSRGRPLNAPAAFIHPCQPIVAKQSLQAISLRMARGDLDFSHED
jgi:hypothetical protein